MPPQKQAELSGSLNHLSEQIAATQQLLQDLTVEPAASPGSESSSSEPSTPSHTGAAPLDDSRTPPLP
ncbi:MAG TPA: hypothetical protein VGD46_06000 [Rhizobacter sp.]